MEKQIKAFRIAMMVSALGGASALLLSGATPAKAGEERLHSSSVKVYGLIPPGENSKDATSRPSRSDTTTTSTTTSKSASMGLGKSGSSSQGTNDEPKLEDPPMPSYDGANEGGNTMASNDIGGGGQISSN